MTSFLDAQRARRWITPACVYLVACFAVCVFPFFFPPRSLLGISVANQLGFNNKVAAVSAAIISGLVFLFALRSRNTASVTPQEQTGTLSRRLVWIACALLGLLYAVLGTLVSRSSIRYTGDAGYLIEQMSAFIDYGRLPYSQLEFPYGPALFYLPVFAYRVLHPFGISFTNAYFVTLVLQHIAGLLCVAYLLDRLPMHRQARNLLFAACAYGAIQLNLGANYSWFRFALPPALLLFAMRRSRAWQVAAALFAGQIGSMCISSELGAAYAVGALTFAAYKTYQHGLPWAPTLAASPVGLLLFMLLVGRAYLLMLTLFAAGILNIVVEPLPHILIFLIPLVLINPYGLAVFVRANRPEAPMLTGLCIFSLALLPVAFGRADPGQVANEGMMVMLLSFVFIPLFRKPAQQTWLIAALLFFLYTTTINFRVYRSEVQNSMLQGIARHPIKGKPQAIRTFLRTGSLSRAKAQIQNNPDEPVLDLPALQQIVGNTPVAAPLYLPRLEEQKLRQANLYAPLFYFGLTGVLDRTAELHETDELNQHHWMLIPRNFHSMLSMTEPPDMMAAMTGFHLHYRVRYPTYVVGPLFQQNLDTYWQLRKQIGEYLLFEHR